MSPTGVEMRLLTRVEIAASQSSALQPQAFYRFVCKRGGWPLFSFSCLDSHRFVCFVGGKKNLLGRLGPLSLRLRHGELSEATTTHGYRVI